MFKAHFSHLEFLFNKSDPSFLYINIATHLSPNLDVHVVLGSTFCLNCTCICGAVYNDNSQLVPYRIPGRYNDPRKPGGSTTHPQQWNLGVICSPIHFTYIANLAVSRKGLTGRWKYPTDSRCNTNARCSFHHTETSIQSAEARFEGSWNIHTNTRPGMINEGQQLGDAKPEL